MQENDIGDHFLLWPSLHAVNSADDKRPAWVIKERPEDFQVWELGKDKELVPFDPDVKIDHETAESIHRSFHEGRVSDREAISTAIMFVGDILGEVYHFFPEEKITVLFAFLVATVPLRPGHDRPTLDPEVVELVEAGMYDVRPRRALVKSERKKIREAVEKYFPHITTEVIRRPGKRARIRFRVLSEAERASHVTYVHFTLKLEYSGIQGPLTELSRNLDVPVTAFTYTENKHAGRAVVYQRVCGRNIDARGLQNYICLSDQVASVVRADEPLSSADSFGNQFTVCIRDIRRLTKSQREALDAMRTDGFINYYGPESFGSASCPAHIIGLHALQKSFAAALRLYLIDQFESVDLLRRCASELKIDDFEANTAENFIDALDVCPRSQWAACAIFETLANDPSNYQEAWECIADETRMGYYKAVQYYIWNRMVSKRLESFGHSLIIGDPISHDLHESHMHLADYALVSADKPLSTPVGVLTDKHFAVTPRHFDIYDLVMPLVGSDQGVKYPAHESCNEAAYAAELKALGAEALRSVGLPGAYRRVFFRPFKFRWYHLESTEELRISCQLPKGCHINAVLREVARVSEAP